MDNFPNRLVAGVMRLVIFPTGRHHHAPSDRLDHQVAKILQVPSATRSPHRPRSVSDAERA
ncbi:DUF1974 domain-containing protein [Klebsiella pneumoniae subsp. pneumoniae]|nr:DUF1974 domain-containing protein [Klebsiella pneumoniae subsp. pneumoniae]